ncbi:MAG: DNA/RNA nuclease SfsA [Gammaproteobacteria bacterium]|nr:DNA/RNA nuclease SfsA [Gammaproteobacteria bacterium]
MDYSNTLIPVTLIRRYKRFLADVEMDDGRVITVHSPNTGSMMGCADPGMRIWIRDTQNPKRKYRYAWEQSETDSGTRININTHLSNRLVQEAIENGTVQELQGYEGIRSEVNYGAQRSRIDLLLERQGQRCYVEVKNVTARRERDGEGVAVFPDAVTARGTKHLEELMHMVEQGERAVIFYCLSRDDASTMQPADDIDPLYGRTLREAITRGVEALAYRVRVDTTSIQLVEPVPVVCP